MENKTPADLLVNCIRQLSDEGLIIFDEDKIKSNEIIKEYGDLREKNVLDKVKSKFNESGYMYEEQIKEIEEELRSEKNG